MPLKKQPIFSACVLKNAQNQNIEIRLYQSIKVGFDDGEEQVIPGYTTEQDYHWNEFHLKASKQYSTLHHTIVEIDLKKP